MKPGLDPGAFTLISLRQCDRVKRESLCRAFYDRVYREAFPVADEAEDCETWLPLFETDEDGKPWLEIIVACAGNAGEAARAHVIGGIVFEWYRASDAWLITYLAVDPNERRCGVGSALFEAAFASIARTQQTRSRERPLVLAEVENPEYVPPAALRNAYQRLQILYALGLLRIDIPYVQPALDANKRPLHTLFLLAYASRDESVTTVAADRVRRFLVEFYAALDQPNAPELQAMLASFESRSQLGALPLALAIPAIYDESLGRARSITVQLLFFDDVFGGRERQRGPGSTDERVDLKALRLAIEATASVERLISGVASYHRDIVVPFLSEGSRPLVIGCESFGGRSETASEGAHRDPVAVWIDLPSTVEIEWEERTVTLPITDPGAPHSAKSIPAALTDFVTLFESGICAYGLSIVLEPHSPDVAVNATVLLLLESLVGAAGTTGAEPLFRKRVVAEAVSRNEEPGLPLDVFLRTRLMPEREANAGLATIFSLFGTDLHGMPPELESKLRDFTFGDAFDSGRRAPNFVALEIVGSDEHDTVLRYAEGARRRDVPIDRFSKRLAGIVQNVMDFEQQDAVEVQDSLMLNWPSGSEITFVHAKAMVWFGRYRRSYFAARENIGSDPYWLLTRLVLGHNEQLLVRLRDELEDLDDRRYDSVPEIDRIVERIRRVRRRIDRYIQNPFRYDSERKMFDFVSDVRGIEQQRRLIAAEEQTLGTRIAEDAANVREEVDARLNNTVIAIGFIQAAGVFVAILSLELEPLRRIFRRAPPTKVADFHALLNYPIPWLMVFLAASFLALTAGWIFVRGPAGRRRRRIGRS